VVDVRPAPGNAAVVQRDDGVTEFRHGGAEPPFASSPGRPRPSRLRIVGERKDQATDPRVRRANRCLPVVVPAGELRLGGGAGLSEVDGAWLRWGNELRFSRHRGDIASGARQAQDRAGCAVPRRALTGVDVNAATTPVRATQSHDLELERRAVGSAGMSSPERPAPAVVSLW
jgi:hypothetical protein